ncbi:MAG: efflux RND transporter periplasmic adaptor subunit [Deltaproteobacteria bacterium]|nr:efflux RND transporter periplasmic adaptor subunit [Deltaproteobacteria bacterium]
MSDEKNASDEPAADQAAALTKLLAAESSGHRSRRWIWILVTLAVLGAAFTFFLRPDARQDMPRYRTEPAELGRLVVKVSATGNLQPTNKVEVSSEQSGIVTEVLVDDNDRVSKGQVLAQLDLSKLKDAVAKSRASLVVAEAQVQQAQATEMEARATLARLREVAELSGGKVPSRSEMDTAEANLKRAEANVASARASVTQARANLQSDLTNLGKASIRSPVDGVVLVRSVEPGQTVAAMFQAPVLFTLAEDLAKMELLVDVDEADVGRVKVGQQATFTVDAWPGRKYTGVISRVGLGSEVKDGVVSYPTLIAVENDDISLRPGMTGTAEIITLTHENALLVPNAALRFTPPATDAAPKGRRGGLVGKLLPGPPFRPRKTQAPARDDTPRVWVLREGRAVPIEVQTGPSNGQMTEIAGGPIEAGTQVITETLVGMQP